MKHTALAIATVKKFLQLAGREAEIAEISLRQVGEPLPIAHAAIAHAILLMLLEARFR